MTSKNNEFLEIFAALIFSNTMKFDNFQRKFPLIPPNPVEAGLKLNAHKTFRRRPGRLLNVICSYSLLSVSTWKLTSPKEVFEIHLGELIKH